MTAAVTERRAASARPQTGIEPLLGRERELEALSQALAEASEPGTRVLVVRGEAGIGKSLLLGHFAEESRRRRVHVVLGRADALERGVPYAPLHHALTRLHPAVYDTTRDLVGRLIDAIGPPAPGEEAGDERLALALAAGWRLLAHLTSGGPVVIAVDDLHAADEETIALLESLARRAVSLPVLIVASLREDLPVPVPAVDRFLADVDAQCRTTTLELGPLAREHVEQLLVDLVGAEIDATVVDDVLLRSGGNAFFVRELAGSLAHPATSAGDASDGADRQPRIRPRRAFALIQRLLPPEGPAHRLARVLSASGDLPLGHLPAAGRVAGLARPEAEDAFDGLVRARLLVACAGSGYHFRHEILREALYGELGPAERQRIHAGLSAALLRLREEGQDVDLASVAHHALAASDGQSEPVAALAQAVGDEIAHFAPRSASSWYQRAVAKTPDGEPALPTRLARQARAQIRSSRLAEGIVTGRAALAGLTDEAERARCVSVMAEALARSGDVEVLAFLDGEIDAGLDHPRLLLDRLAALTALGRLREARSLADHVRSRLAPEGSSDYLLALSCSAQLADAEGRLDEVEVLMDEQLQLAERMPRPAQAFVYGSVAAFLAVQGRVDRAERALQQAHAVSADDHLATPDERLDLAHAFLDFFRGSWDEALVRTERQRALLGTTLASGSLPFFELIDATIRSSRGDLVTAREVAGAESRPASPRFRALQHGTRGWIELLDGRPADARRELEAGLDGASGSVRSLIQAQLARACHLVGDPEAARRHLAEADAVALAGYIPYAHVEVLLARAEIDQDVESARQAHDAALVTSPAFHAAQAQLLRGQLGDDPQETLTDAWRTFRRLGADVWRGRAAAALRARRLPVPRAPRRHPEGLSEIEQEIACLVHAGLSNQQIAERLSYSKHTINAYLTRIYARTGFASRFDLVRAISEGVQL